MVAFVPARTYRYILPLAPFILFYFLNGIQAIETRFRSRTGSLTPAVRIVATCMALLFVAEHAQYIARRYVGPIPSWLLDYRETTLVTDRVERNTLPDEIIATNNPGLVFLATGGKTVVLTDIRNSWPLWARQACATPSALQVARSHPPSPIHIPSCYETPIHRLWILQVIPPVQDP